MPRSLWYGEIWQSGRERVGHWFLCRVGKHVVKMQSYGRCIYCNRQVSR
jgi:hypothetical protein